MLSKDGYRLLALINKTKVGFDITEEELDEGLAEAEVRISGGKCHFCDKGDENTELRYGMCFKCFKKGGQ